MSKIQIKSAQIKAWASECGFDACGIAKFEPNAEARKAFQAWIREGKHAGMKYLEDFDLRAENFLATLPKIKSVIALGVNYFSENSLKPESKKLTGRIARYAWGKDYHLEIPEIQKELIRKIKAENPEVFLEGAVDTKPIFERSFAREAGLGFIGKQSQLLSLGFGPWLFLSELLTDLELEPDPPHLGSCGTCRICIDECPTAAIDETGRVDARKCIAYLTIENKNTIPESLRPKIGNWVFGCDECLNVCPYTAKEKATQHKSLTADSGHGPAIDLEELFSLKTEKEYEAYFSGSAVLRAKRKQLLRNACVVMGNSKDKRAVPFLQKALHDASDLVREHVFWALRQIENQ